ncbi:hypothetical protein [Lentibacillus sediminis]|uniref:hypothetical protein n=1 Tax=Lentibacillus sediminis TaxID=1940529 RepID=UPI0018646E13|nr:hypothetical protein [Lentibacillus sediminis]
MKTANLRKLFFRILRITGDIKAVKNGTIVQRVTRRAGRKQSRKILRKLFK